MFSLKLNGIKDLQDLYSSAADELADEIKDAVANAADLIADAAKKNCKGKLADSIVATVADDGMSATVSTDSPFAAFVEYGASIPEIHAEKTKVLHWKKDGKDVFARSAKAHDNVARPFLNPAFEEQADGFMDTLNDITGQ